jgi:hypothetical protein
VILAPRIVGACWGVLPLSRTPSSGSIVDFHDVPGSIMEVHPEVLAANAGHERSVEIESPDLGAATSCWRSGLVSRRAVGVELRRGAAPS